MSSEKVFVNMMYQDPRKQEKSPAKPFTKVTESRGLILSGNLTFK